MESPACRPCCPLSAHPLPGLLSFLVAADVSIGGATHERPPAHFPPVYAPTPVVREAGLALESALEASVVLQPAPVSAATIAALLAPLDAGTTCWPHSGAPPLSWPPASATFERPNEYA